MREDGYYWCEIHEFGSIDVVAYKDGAWVKDWPVREADVSVIGEALALPADRELAGHAGRLARLARAIFEEDGADPRWDGVHIDGAYWIRRDGHEPELALSIEGGWCSYLRPLPGYDWEVLPGGAAPPVLFGPLDRPGGRHRRGTYLATLLEHERRQARSAEAGPTAKSSRKPKAPRVFGVPKARGH